MVTIKTSINKNQLKDFIHLVYKTCRSEPYLSPRPKVELRKAYDDGKFLIAMDGEKPIGWLILIPYTNKVQELVAGFVLESYRSKGIFSKLVRKGLAYAPISILVTFNRTLERHLTQTGFRNSSFWETLRLSNGRLLLDRLNFERLKAISSHYQIGKPKYLIFMKHE